MATRAEPRHLVRLPIKITGTDELGNRFAQTAFTYDVSIRGARITQVPPLLWPAAIINVAYRGRRSRFRVVWVGGLGNNEVGVLSLEPRRCIWGTPLPGQLIRSLSPDAPTIAALPPVMGAAPASSNCAPSIAVVAQQKRKRVGYFCKNPACREIRAFHLINDDRVIWDIWPQKIECPASGQRYEYWNGDIRSAGYL